MKKCGFICRTLFLCAACLFAAVSAFAQIGEYKEVQRDTLERGVTDTVVTTVLDTASSGRLVVNNRFWRNWFVTASGGIHSFRGDYSRFGSFKGTLSPEGSVGFGKWFLPWLAVKSEFIYSASRGYSGIEYESQKHTTPYGYGEWIPISGVDHLNYYRPMKIGPWWDVSLSTTLNLTRLIRGYEGNSKKSMNQWLVSVGAGATHKGKQDNNISGHVELQYSRFFTKDKRVSLDVKIRDLMYDSDFDGEHGQGNFRATMIDHNLGVHAGLTFFFGGYTNWNGGTRTVYRDKYRDREIHVLRDRDEGKNAVVVVAKEKPVKRGSLTFFVFYPNNYSGRNDAPLNATSPVNAIDYLAGGIFTQKQYANNDMVAARIQEGRSLKGLTVIDLPTEPADSVLAVDFIPRGYEMVEGKPISLSLASAEMSRFADQAGYYYAPIFDGQNVWQYRIDDAALGQHLINASNYQETDSYGLNAHAGLSAIKQNMTLDAGDELVSFADVYAALNSDEGYISRFADSTTVEQIRHILNDGLVMLIQVEGRSTNQGNFGDARTGEEWNAELAENRANTVISWLTDFDQMKDVKSQIFLLNGKDAVRKVDDPSTRGMNAKLNRCVKVRIHYMLQE